MNKNIVHGINMPIEILDIIRKQSKLNERSISKEFVYRIKKTLIEEGKIKKE